MTRTLKEQACDHVVMMIKRNDDHQIEEPRVKNRSGEDGRYCINIFKRNKLSEEWNQGFDNFFQLKIW